MIEVLEGAGARPSLSLSYVCKFSKAVLKMDAKLECEVDEEGAVDMMGGGEESSR